MKPHSDWKSRALTLALLVGGAFATAVVVEAVSRQSGLSSWFLAVAGVISVAAYRAVRSLAQTVTGGRGYLLDTGMSIPLGLVVVAKELALPVTGWVWSMILGSVLFAVVVIFASDYFYRRHPRTNTADGV